MKRYVVRRLLMAIPLLLAISFVCFCFINLIPSNPAEVALRVQQTPVITDEIIAAMEEQLGLNKPFFVRYFDWVLGCLHGDFGISYISTYIRLIRNNMLENMKQDYVLYANVRGLPQKSILVKHILKNSMHTCIVAMGMSIPQLISGTIVVENVFSWPGLGTLCISSIFNRDYPVIQTYVLLIGVLFVLFNLLFDILQTVSDPRLRKED